MASIEEAPFVPSGDPERNQRFWDRKLGYCEDLALLVVLAAAVAIPFLSTAAFVFAIATYVSLAFSVMTKN